MDGGKVEAKRQLRTALRQARLGISPEDRARLSTAIADGLTGHSAWREAQDVAAFVGRPDEPDTVSLLRATLAAGKRLWLPRVTGDDPPTMQWVLTARLQSLTEGRFGILEPIPDRGRAPGRIESMDLVLVPGLAFDRTGCRIGAGFGYYDRALEAVRASDAVLRFGLCFDRFLDPVEGEIPAEPHDVRMHAVCTESGVVQCMQSSP